MSFVSFCFVRRPNNICRKTTVPECAPYASGTVHGGKRGSKVHLFDGFGIVFVDHSPFEFHRLGQFALLQSERLSEERNVLHLFMKPSLVADAGLGLEAPA